MNDLSSYWSAMISKREIERIHAKASEELRALSGGGPMGMTPDKVKQSPEYRAALSCFNYWQARLCQFNAAFLKAYGREYRAEMRKARESRPCSQ